MKKYFAEIFGTFWLVFGGCGSAILAGGGIGLVGISLAFGLTVLTMAYAVGHISGGHFNPAVSIGLWAGGKFSGKDLPGYIVSQLVGAVLAAGALYLIVTGSDKEIGGFAANGYDSLSPGGFSMMSAFIAEFLLTAFFLLVILGSTNKRAPKGFAPLAIGLCLTLIHLISIPITNTSVNPARSSSQALFAGGDFLPQTWLFWVAPILGAIVAGFIHKALFDKE